MYLFSFTRGPFAKGPQGPEGLEGPKGLQKWRYVALVIVVVVLLISPEGMTALRIILFRVIVVVLVGDDRLRLDLGRLRLDLGPVVVLVLFLAGRSLKHSTLNNEALVSRFLIRNVPSVHGLTYPWRLRGVVRGVSSCQNMGLSLSSFQ